MAKIELRPSSVVPERFRSPSPEVTVFIASLMSYVDQHAIVVKQGEDNAIHLNIRPANRKPLFFEAFYCDHPQEAPGGSFILGGLERQTGNTQIDGQNYSLYTSYELIYQKRQGFVIRESQSAIPDTFDEIGSITLRTRRLTTKGIQRLTRRIQGANKNNH